jgi:hypothetical protein
MRKIIRSLIGCGLLLGFGLCAEAQQVTKIARIGVLPSGSSSSMAPQVEAFRQGLHALGYVKGKNILLEYRYGRGQA